jgi:hypothetical protein
MLNIPDNIRVILLIMCLDMKYSRKKKVSATNSEQMNYKRNFFFVSQHMKLIFKNVLINHNHCNVVILEIIKWCLNEIRKRFLKFNIVILQFVFISPCILTLPFIWTDLNLLHLRKLFAKFSLHWHTGSGESW